MMTTFPSSCRVFQAVEGQRCVVTVFGCGTGCVATGATMREAEAKALLWMTNNLSRAGLLGRVGILEAELSRLCAVLASLSTDCE